MKQLCNVVMLSTNEARIGNNDIVKLHAKGQSGLVIMSNYTDLDGIQQHLYITSNEEIKEGDWCIEFINNIPTNVLQIKGKDFKRCLHNYEKLLKIIATTDKSIQIPIPNGKYNIGNLIGCTKNLPQPSQQFIEKYIEEYNKGNIITNVEVEYEKSFDYKDKTSNLGYGYGFEENLKLKVNKDNTITIKKVKDSWSREEVIALFESFSNTIDEFYNGQAFNNSNYNKWIEENL